VFLVFEGSLCSVIFKGRLCSLYLKEGCVL